MAKIVKAKTAAKPAARSAKAKTAKAKVAKAKVAKAKPAAKSAKAKPAAKAVKAKTAVKPAAKPAPKRATKAKTAKAKTAKTKLAKAAPKRAVKSAAKTKPAAKAKAKTAKAAPKKTSKTAAKAAPKRAAKPAVKSAKAKTAKAKPAKAAPKKAAKTTANAAPKRAVKAKAAVTPAVKPVEKPIAKIAKPAVTPMEKPAVLPVPKPALKPILTVPPAVKPIPKPAPKPSAIKLGIAPIGWTNDDLPELGGHIPFEQCISEMALAGFSGSEVGNKYPKDPRLLNDALKRHGLTICNAWFSSFLTTAPYEEVEAAFIKHRDFLYSVGARVIGAAEQGHSIQGKEEPIFDNKPHFTDEEWRRLTSGLNKLGELAAQKGMKLTYHHHMGTGVQTAAEIDRLMENTDPKLLGLLYDTGHLVFAGENHLAVLDKWISRIRHVHLKDMRSDVRRQALENKWSFLYAVKQGVFTVPGDGCIDFGPVFKTLIQAKYEGWWVVEAEQDPAKANPLEYAVKARSYIRAKANL